MDVSVIIPIYNVEKYLKECLDSVEKNIRAMDAEVLLIDDGSSDDSSVIAKNYADNNKMFFYHRKDNGGLSSARNFGVAHARGEYILFVDSDDMIVEGILEKMYQAAKQNDTDITICDVAKLKSGKIQASDIHLQAYQDLKGVVTHITKHPNLVFDSTATNKLIRRSFYLENNFAFPEGRRYEDIPVIIPAHYRANGVAIIRETGYIWRIREGSITQLYDQSKSILDKIDMITGLFEYMKSNNVEDDIREAYENKVVRVDFSGFIDALEFMPIPDAESYIELIATFVEKHVRKEVIDSLPLMRKQIFSYIKDRDLKNLKHFLRYKKGNYVNLPVYKTDTGLEFSVRDEFFTINDRCANTTFESEQTRCLIDAVNINENKIVLVGHLYIRRIDIHPGEQIVRAYAFNEMTGDKIDLVTEACETKFLTQEFGTVLNYDDYKK